MYAAAVSFFGQETATVKRKIPWTMHVKQKVNAWESVHSSIRHLAECLKNMDAFASIYHTNVAG